VKYILFGLRSRVDSDRFVFIASEELS